MVKDIIEDVKRHKSDNVENNRDSLMAGGKTPPTVCPQNVRIFMII
jgi:hypothetical protein